MDSLHVEIVPTLSPVNLACVIPQRVAAFRPSAVAWAALIEVCAAPPPIEIELG
jgi:hypothetical protein